MSILPCSIHASASSPSRFLRGVLAHARKALAGNIGGGLIQTLGDFGDQLVYLVLRDDEGWGQDHAVLGGAHDQTIFHTVIAADAANVTGFVESFAGVLVFTQLNTGNQPGHSHLADDGVGLELSKTFSK